MQGVDVLPCRRNNLCRIAFRSEVQHSPLSKCRTARAILDVQAGVACRSDSVSACAVRLQRWGSDASSVYPSITAQTTGKRFSFRMWCSCARVLLGQTAARIVHWLDEDIAN